MALLKTTILPTDDGPLACKMMREWIDTKPHVLWITVGSDGDAQATAERGDGMAGAAQDERWCLWARDPALVRPVFETLDPGRWKVADLMVARAFTLSRDDQVRDVIARTEPVPKNLRALQAYARAEAAAP